MQHIIEIFKKNKGYARMIDLKNMGIHTRTVAKAVREGVIEKIKPGLYKLVDYPWDEHEGFTDVCRANKNAVICLLSAASYYGLTTYDPDKIHVAVPHNTDKFNLEFPPIKVYFFIEKFYNIGIEKVQTSSGPIKIYCREKTIADLFRYQNKIGEDLLLESLKNYVHDKKNRNIGKLMEFAEVCGVRNKLEPALKGLLL